MAKVIGALLSLEARGQFHNTLVFQHKRQGICKFKFPVKYLKTPLQIKMRYIYGQCVGTWRCMSAEQKEYYKSIKYKNSMTGFNMFYKLFMKVRIHATYGVTIYGVVFYGA